MSKKKIPVDPRREIVVQILFRELLEPKIDLDDIADKIITALSMNSNQKNKNK